MPKRVAMSELSPLLEEALQKGQEVILTVTGSSMAPLLHHRQDKVCLVKPPEKPLKKYDLPLFVRKDGNYILHRIVGVKPEGYIARGDNQLVKEYPVSPSQVIGVVKGFWRRGKYLSSNNLWYRLYCRVWFYGLPVRWGYLKWKRWRGDKRRKNERPTNS